VQFVWKLIFWFREVDMSTKLHRLKNRKINFRYSDPNSDKSNTNITMYELVRTQLYSCVLTNSYIVILVLNKTQRG